MKWLKAQELTNREKAFHFYYLWDNPDFRKARLNPLRRLWQAPGDALERALRPAMGLQPAFITKWFVGKSLWKTKTSKPMTMPDNPNYPKKDPKFERNEPHKYYDQGFSKAAHLNLKTSTPTTWD